MQLYHTIFQQCNFVVLVHHSIFILLFHYLNIQLIFIIILCVLQGLSVGALDTGGSVCILRLHGLKVDPWMQAFSFFFAVGTTVHISIFLNSLSMSIHFFYCSSIFLIDISIYRGDLHRYDGEPHDVLSCHRDSHVRGRDNSFLHANIQVGA